MEKQKYGLVTAITMITGVVIGSGIFFKSDDVLTYTNGNVLLGVMVFCIAAVAIIFGCLTISELATRTDKPGGLISYAEDFVGTGVACAFGWFQTFLYLPTISAVVAWVTGMYITQLFGLPSSNDTWTITGVIILSLFFFLNVLSAKLGGYFQNASMIIKLVPLLLIAVAGLLFGDVHAGFSTDMTSISTNMSSSTWMSAFAPIAFSFDGWIVSTAICHEVKNSKKNFPIALAVAPLIILVVYVSYFVGISYLVGPENVLIQQNDSVYTAANMLFGNIGAKLILVFVIVSVVGTVNGLVLGYIRLPYSLAVRGMIPMSKSIAKENKSLGDMPVNSAVVAYISSIFWLIVHYITQKYGMSGDVSEIAICISYINYIVLYIAVIRLAMKGEIKSKWKGYVVPILAIIGSLMILSGSIQNPMFPYYVLVCAIIMGAGFLYYRLNTQKQSRN